MTYPNRRVTHEDNGDAKMGSSVWALMKSSKADLSRLPPTMAPPRMPSSGNFRAASNSVAQASAKRTKLR